MFGTDIFQQPSKSSLRRLVSISSMPIPVIDSLPPFDELGRPEGLKGWEDLLHKAELSKDEQEDIQELQRGHGLPLTGF